ncbi:MAG TPA: glycoside hydrolase family 20 zincin-like fold domain-containing protein [Armatimonadota bacterium]|nr:glycoside hydrolase family 20 zincin-like fold domain-containing protein [Armatimonadota bacterium]
MRSRSGILWPLPQDLRWRDDALPLDQSAAAVPGAGQEGSVRAARLLADLVADDFGLVVPLVEGKPRGGKLPIAIRIESSGLPAEGYRLRVTAEGAEIVGEDESGARHGVATLIQLAERRGETIVVRGAEIRDWPYKPVRMVHLFLPGEDHLSYARRYLRDFLVRYKFNGLFVEVGGGVRLRNRPEIALGWRRFVEELRAIGDTVPIYGEHVPLGPERRFAASVHTHLADGRYVERDDLARLSEWARGYGLDFVPEVQSLAHAYYLACAHPDIAELPCADFPDTYCPSNPRSHEILFDVMSEIVDLTKCESVHIGHDEWRAGGLCPRCRERDTGELFAEDVVKIAAWLRERGRGVWMWGDHLVPKHNGRRRSRRGEVWYDYPDTMAAARIIADRAPEIRLLNWSWYLGAEDADRVLADLGFKQIYGNFAGRRFENWEARSEDDSVLGAAVSSWSAWDDFELGVLHYPEALYGANLLWSNRSPEGETAEALIARELPRLRDRMRRSWEKPRLWSVAAPERWMRPVSIAAACNAPAEGPPWDLRGLRAGRQTEDGVPYELVSPQENRGLIGVAVARRHQPADDLPHSSAPIPVGARAASLVFWQVATEEGGSAFHAGDETHHPREAHELLGWYEVAYSDGLTRCAEVRYGENVAAWNEGHRLLYHGREARAGDLPDGTPLVIWGLEWTNPRPAVAVESVTLHGARALPEMRRPEKGASEARPMLLAITAVGWPKWEDYRPEKGGKVPGLEEAAR